MGFRSTKGLDELDEYSSRKQCGIFPHGRKGVMPCKLFRVRDLATSAFCLGFASCDGVHCCGVRVGEYVFFVFFFSHALPFVVKGPLCV